MENFHENEKEGKDGSTMNKKTKRQRESDPVSSISPPSKKLLQTKQASPKEVLKFRQSAAVASASNLEEDRKYDDKCHVDLKKCEDIPETNESSSVYNSDNELIRSYTADELDISKPLEALYPQNHSQNSIECTKDQTISSRYNLSKSISEDSLDQDVSLTDSLYQEACMTESGDFSYDISGTECESLTSSQYLLQDDSGLHLPEEQSSLSKSAPSPSKIEDAVSSIADSTKKHEGKKKRKKRSRHSSKKSTAKNEAQGADAKILRPNYFVGIQISNADIHKAIVKVQEDMVVHDECLMRALVDVATSHITLLVAHIDTEEALAVASTALEKCGNRVKEDLSACPLHLTFSGISHFGHQVVYAQLVEDDHYHRLLDLGECVRSVFTECQVCMPDTRTLFPHLTIAKLSKAPRIKGKHAPRKIDSASYSQHLNSNFGCQTVAGLQLLGMNKPKDQNRYFYNSAQVLFDFKVRENTDHSVCCFPRRPILDPHRTKTQHRPYSTVAAEKDVENKTKPDDDASEPSWFLPTFGVLTAVAAGVLLAIIIPRIRNR